jgi:hypothetical protein
VPDRRGLAPPISQRNEIAGIMNRFTEESNEAAT